MTGQGPITFHNVAASFSEEQWMRLEKSQKELYRHGMKEIHRSLLALGYTILDPNILFSVRKQDESYVCIDSHYGEKKSAVVGDFPDILMKIKEEPIGETPISQGEHCVLDHQPSTSYGLASLNIKQEQSTYVPVGSGAETKFTDSLAKASNAVRIKTEEEGFSIDDYNRAGGEGSPRSSAGVPSVKQEPDDEETDNEDLENIIPVIVKKEEADPAISDYTEEPQPAYHHVDPQPAYHHADLQPAYHHAELQPARHSANGGNGGDKHKRGKTEPVLLEAKMRRIGPQVHGDILSLEEREARRLKVLEGNVKPFLEQPSFTFDPTKTASDIKLESADVSGIRKDTENADWCKCGHCSHMSTVEESVCCHEISGMNYPLNDDCITLHPTFQEWCLDRDRLDFLFRFLGRMKRRNDVSYYLHKLRRMSYRAFVVWAHGFLDKRDCKPVPACVVKVVQERLPYPEELNVGYTKIYDYPAAIMALDHI